MVGLSGGGEGLKLGRSGIWVGLKEDTLLARLEARRSGGVAVGLTDGRSGVCAGKPDLSLRE